MAMSQFKLAPEADGNAQETKYEPTLLEKVMESKADGPVFAMGTSTKKQVEHNVRSLKLQKIRLKELGQVRNFLVESDIQDSAEPKLGQNLEIENKIKNMCKTKIEDQRKKLRAQKLNQMRKQ